MNKDIEKILVDEDIIHKRVKYLANRFREDCEANGIEELTVVVLLKGALLFAADFVRHLDMKIKVECINASSYNGGTKSTGVVAIDHTPNVLNRDVLLIDDILDTGLTMESVRKQILDAGAASVTTCVLLDKRVSPNRCEYTGFDIPNEFVVGYGLDFDGHYRNLPYVGILKIEGTDKDDTRCIECSGS